MLKFGPWTKSISHLTLIEFEIIDLLEVANLILVSVYDKYVPAFSNRNESKFKFATHVK